MRDGAAGARIGDYQVTRTLPGTSNELEATHVLLPRRARIVIGDATSIREARILEALRHPGVPRVYECGRFTDGRPWIAIELLDGPTVADLIRDRALTTLETLALLRDLAEVLHHAHMRGIVHCRLRPAYVVADVDGARIIAWADASTRDTPPVLAGVDGYLAPELARGAPFEVRADIYSLGVIAYEALTRAAPTRPLARCLPALPRALVVLIDRMMSGTALARPTAAEVRAEAMRVLDTLASPPDDGEPVIEDIDVELADDLSRDPAAHVQWTPARPYRPPPPTSAQPSRRKST